MCRISVLTANRLSTSVRKAVFHSLMNYSFMEGQTDGAGFTDGQVIVKTDQGFPSLHALMISRLSPTRTWLGHVRKRSSGTDQTVDAAHPYEYRSGKANERLILIHNGFITGTTALVGDATATDTFRAGRDLATMLDGRPLTQEIIENWVNGFSYGSEWSFGIWYQDTLHMVRGQRDLYAVQVGRDKHDLMINTSKTVLDHVSNYIALIRPDLEMGKPLLIPPHHYAAFSADGVAFGAYKYAPPVAPDPRPTLYVSDGTTFTYT